MLKINVDYIIFQSSSEFKMLLEKLQDILLDIFQSSSEFKLVVFKPNTSSKRSTFNPLLSLRDSINSLYFLISIFTFNPLLSLSDEYWQIMDALVTFFQSSSEFKSSSKWKRSKPNFFLSILF